MSGSSVKKISLGDGFGDVALKVNGATIEVHADGSVAAHTTGDVDAYTNASVRVHAAANDGLSDPPAANAAYRLLSAKATPEIGDRERDGDHKGEIYRGIFPDGKPGWILEEPEPMTHYDAAELKGRALPTSKEGKYIDTIKDKGALKEPSPATVTVLLPPGTSGWPASTMRGTSSSATGARPTTSTGTAICRSCLLSDDSRIRASRGAGTTFEEAHLRARAGDESFSHLIISCGRARAWRRASS
jgi:hypothetical protein